MSSLNSKEPEMTALSDLLTTAQKEQIGGALKHGYFTLTIQGHNWQVTDCDVTLKSHQPCQEKGEPNFDF